VRSAPSTKRLATTSLAAHPFVFLGLGKITLTILQYKLIDDNTCIKDVFMLKNPTEAPTELSHLFDYQLTVFNSIRLVDEQTELHNNEVHQLIAFRRFSNRLMAFRMPLKPLNGFAVQIPTGPLTLSVCTSAPSLTPHPMRMAWHGPKKDHVQQCKPHASWSMHLLQATTPLHPRTCPSLR
jgi:hypothetical protein